MFRLAAIFALIANTAAADPNFWKFEWPNTDFETTNVQSWVEILSGGPPNTAFLRLMGRPLSMCLMKAALQIVNP